MKFDRHVPFFLHPFIKLMKVRRVKTVKVNIVKDRDVLERIKEYFANKYMKPFPESGFGGSELGDQKLIGFPTRSRLS